MNLVSVFTACKDNGVHRNGRIEDKQDLRNVAELGIFRNEKAPANKLGGL
jgi:hypothetical protein